MRMARADRGDDGVVRVVNRVVGRREQLRLERGVALERSVPVEVIGRHVEQRRGQRPEAVGRLHLEARDLEHVGVRVIARACRAQAGRSCRRPARRAPALASISAASVATVLLPLLPVTAITGAFAARANSSTSPITSSPRRRASATSGMSTDRPGESSTRLTSSSQRASSVASSTSAVGARAVERGEPRRRRAAVDHAHALAERAEVARDGHSSGSEPHDQTRRA